MLVAVHGLAVRLSERCHKSPLTELLKPDGCRAPPRSSHRAAGARHHQRLAREWGAIKVKKGNFPLILQCRQTPPPIQGASETERNQRSPSQNDTDVAGWR